MSGGDKPSGPAADEVLKGRWIDVDPSAFGRASQQALANASAATASANSNGTGAQQASIDKSAALKDAADQYGLDQSVLNTHSGDWANKSGWYQFLESESTQCQNDMRAAVQSHQGVHDVSFPKTLHAADWGAVQAIKDDDLEKSDAKVAAALARWKSAEMTALAGIRTGKPPPGGTPKTPAHQDDPTHKSATPPADAPQQTPAQSSAPGASAAGSSPAASAAPPAPSHASAPSAPASPFTPPAAAPSSSGGGLPAASSGGGASNSSPLGSMPFMPPQMPMQSPMGGAPMSGGQTPGADLVKNIADAARGGHNGGVPLDAKTLDKLLDAQGTNGAGGDHKVPEHHTEPKPVGAGAVYSDPLTHPNTVTSPAQHSPNEALGAQQPPSPAAPAVTAEPPVSHPPVTRLQGDE